MITVYIGLGSNLNHPPRQIRHALQALAVLPGSILRCASSVYRSPALTGPGVPANQPDYYNAVAELDTGLTPEALLDQVQRIEIQQGRQRDDHYWAPRVLDLDILLYGDWIMDTARLRVPHPAIAQRNFVLAPLVECAPDLFIPGHGALLEVLARCPQRDLCLYSGDPEC